MSFVTAHFVTYARDLGYHPTAAAGAFSLIGAAALIGGLYLGHLSDLHVSGRMEAVHTPDRRGANPRACVNTIYCVMSTLPERTSSRWS